MLKRGALTSAKKRARVWALSVTRTPMRASMETTAVQIASSLT